ncbi:MAG: hypothetical protein N2035_09245 [Chthoniobacterales bacterium]|nr:hypothetical protein [Chthoniobacterales bacterium]
MFLRRNRKQFQGEGFEDWTLGESAQTELGPRKGSWSARSISLVGNISARGKDLDASFPWWLLRSLCLGKARLEERNGLRMFKQRPGILRQKPVPDIERLYVPLGVRLPKG